MVKGEARAALILGEEPRVVVSVARSLADHGIAVDLGMLSGDQPVLRSRAIRHCFRLGGEGSSPDSFSSALLLVADLRQYDMLFPVSDASLTVVM